MKDPAGTLVMRLHYHGPADHTPVEMISRARLEHLERMEAEALAVRAVLGIPECQNLPHTMKKATD